LYDLEGNLLKIYSSGIELDKEFNWSRGSISKCLSNRNLVIHKRIIIFENDLLSQEDIEYCKNKGKLKEVFVYDLDMNFLKHFKSVYEASLFLQCKDAEVRMCCLKRRSRIKNYITRYEQS
jgi:predicted transposase YbfD/YdcC